MAYPGVVMYVSLEIDASLHFLHGRGGLHYIHDKKEGKGDPGFIL